jgi:hypothetical protein
MFNWLTRKKENLKSTQKSSMSDKKAEDAIEESLWEIKEEYDLPTEEVITVVELKRRNLEHMHEMISKKEKYE